MKKSFEQQLPCPFTTIANFSHENPEFTKGGLKWLIFNKREELITKNVIRYWGKKVLIHRRNFYDFILNGGTENIT